MEAAEAFRAKGHSESAAETMAQLEPVQDGSILSTCFVSRSQCRTLPSLLARKVRTHIVLQAFYIEALFELANLGETEDMVVCDHFCDHLIGRIGRKREAEIGVLIRWRGVLIRRALVEDDAAAQVMHLCRDIATVGGVQVHTARAAAGAAKHKQHLVGASPPQAGIVWR